MLLRAMRDGGRTRQVFLQGLQTAAVIAYHSIHPRRYRHMTFLEGFVGSESIHLFPTMDWALHDGGGRAWFVETATERWMPSPVYNMGWVTSWRLLPCDLPRLAGESEPSQFRPIASRAAIGERPISRITKGCTSA